MNNFIDFTLTFDAYADANNEELTTFLRTISEKYSKIYSYIMYCKFDGKPTRWKLQILIADNSQYNVIDIKTISKDIFDSIAQSKTLNIEKCTKAISYKQPTLDIMLIVYDPLIRKLVSNKVAEWPMLEYDDALQICYYALLKLYNKKYYIHKYLLIKAFNNEILMYLRKYKNMPLILSLDELRTLKQDNGEVHLIDAIIDDKFQQQFERTEDKEVDNKVFCKIKRIIISATSERQFDELFNAYTNKCVRPDLAIKLQRIKHKLANYDFWEDLI